MSDKGVGDIKSILIPTIGMLLRVFELAVKFYNSIETHALLTQLERFS